MGEETESLGAICSLLFCAQVLHLGVDELPIDFGPLSDDNVPNIFREIFVFNLPPVKKPPGCMGVVEKKSVPFICCDVVNRAEVVCLFRSDKHNTKFKLIV